MSKRDVSSAQDKLCACTQARIEKCLDVEYKLIELWAIRRDETRQEIKQRERYVIVIVTIYDAKSNKRLKKR